VMTGVPWLIPSSKQRGLSLETITLVEDPRVTDVFVLGNGRVYVDTGMGTNAAEGLMHYRLEDQVWQQAHAASLGLEVSQLRAICFASRMSTPSRRESGPGVRCRCVLAPVRSTPNGTR
jgi:Flp pilus assembly CpaF family ATPase